MNSDNAFKNMLMMVLALFTLGYFIYSFIYGDRKSILVILSITSAIVAIYSVAKNFRILNSENSEKKYIAKIALIRVMFSSLLLLIVIPIAFIFFT